jgi:hypothetical protein
MPLLVRAKDIYEGWFKAVIAVLDHGSWTSKEDSKILEVEDLVLHVEDLSRPRKHPEVLDKVGSLSPAQLEAYAKQFASPDRMGFTYTYGERLRAYSCPKCGSSFDQISFIKEKLSRFPSTNQAVVVLYNPLRDSDSSRHNDPPVLELGAVQAEERRAARDGRLQEPRLREGPLPQPLRHGDDSRGGPSGGAEEAHAAVRERSHIRGRLQGRREVRGSLQVAVQGLGRF